MARSILLAFALGAALLGGCGSDGDPAPSPNAPAPPANNPVPAITALSPASADVGGGTFTLTVQGTNFQQNSIVYWNGSARPTTFLSNTQLSAIIAVADIASISPIQVTVVTPVPGGGVSAAQVFQILRLTPIITSISPSSTTAGSAPLRLTVEGSKFDLTAKIQWNGSDLATQFVSSTQLTAILSSADVATARTALVTVRAPAPGGGISSAATFTVLPPVPHPVPVIASLLPPALTAGVTGLAVTVTGTGFVAGSVGQWNGTNRATVVKSSTQLLLAPLPGDLAAAGTALVTVTNPAPGGGMSGSLVASISALAAGAIGVTDRLSVAADFAEALGVSYGAGAISAGGRFIAFESDASNLVPGDTNGATDVFVRDTCRGASACTPTISRVSVANDGSQGAASSATPAMSADGRFVTFASYAATLVSGDINGKIDIFLRDTCAGATGCVPSTTLVSVSGSGAQGADDSGSPTMSADGRYVSFHSRAGNLVSGDTNASGDIFLRDTCGGTSACSPSTIRVSVANDGSQSAGTPGPESYEPAIGADGRFVAFTSSATNLVASDTNNGTDIFVRDTCNGVASCTPSTARVSLDSAGGEANNYSFLPGISADGRFVVFTSWASDMVPDDTNGHDVFVRDTCRGASPACTPSNRRVSVSSSGAQANQNSGGPATGGASISADGRFVAFGSRASNLVAVVGGGEFEIFLRDTCEGAIGCTPSTKRLSVALDGFATQNGRSDYPVISADGHFVTFVSSSTALLPGDTNGMSDVFLAMTGVP